MLQVVSAQREDPELVITVEGDSASEVTSAEARQLAIDVAPQHGMSQAGVSRTSGPYRGEAVTAAQVKHLEPADPKSRFRNDIWLLARL